MIVFYRVSVKISTYILGSIYLALPGMDNADGRRNDDNMEISAIYSGGSSLPVC